MALSEAELERMVVRLVGDATQYMKSMEEAAKKTQETAEKIEHDVHNIEGFTNSVREFGEATERALAALGIAELGRESFAAFNEMENVTIDLTAAIKTHGEEVEATMEKYTDFAEQMEKTTTFSHRATLAMVQQAETFGVTGDAAENAVKQAMALAAAGHMNEQMALRVVTAMQNGNYEMLRWVPALRVVHDPAQRVALAHKMIAQGMEELEKKAQTTQGQLKQLGNQWEGVQEKMGAVVAQGILPMIRVLKELLDWFDRLGPTAKTVAISIVAFAGAVTATIATLTAARFAVSQLWTTIAENPWAMAAVLLVAATVAAVSIGAAMFDASEDGKKLAETLKGLQGQAESVAGAFDKESEAIKATIPTGAAGQGPLTVQLEKTKKDLADQEKVLEDAKKKMDAFNNESGGLKWMTRNWFGGDAASREMAAGIKIQEAAVSSLQRRAQDLSSSLKDIKDPKLDPKVIGHLKDLEQKFNDEANAVRGASKAAEVLAFQHKHNLPDAMVASALAAAKHADEVKKAEEAERKLWNLIESTTKGMAEEIETFGMSANQKKVWKLAAEGAAEAQVQLAQSQADYLDLLAMAKKVHEEAMTPQMKAREQYDKLSKAYNAGLVPQNEYAAGLKKITKELQHAAKAADMVSGKLDAVAYGSAEAQSHIDAYFDSIKSGTASDIAAQFTVSATGPGAVQTAVSGQGGPQTDNKNWQSSVLAVLNKIANGMLNKAAGVTVEPAAFEE